MTSRSFPRGPAAFSLVEVALAVGIIAFALTAILGLMSVGMNASRDTGDSTKIAFIMQDVAARVRAEVASVGLLANPTTMDLSWNTGYNNNLNYSVLSNTTLPADSVTGLPQPSATAYYTIDGSFVKQSSAATPTFNYYKAAIFIQPLPSYPFPTPSPTPSAAQSTNDYPFLAVTVKLGWPTDNTVNGKVIVPANAAKSVFTFYLLKP